MAVAELMKEGSLGRIMDRDEALRLLKGGEQGIAEGNRRRDAGEVIPQLTEANLESANLSGANLSVADLGWAKLFQANLSGANLRGAKLVGTNFILANLRDGNLVEANLSGANLNRADLGGSNLTRCIFNHTTFGAVDLSAVKALEDVGHIGPSTIGIDTLFQSKGNIPEAFLRGCGVPESVIVNRFDVVGAMEPIQFYSCFISYSHQDEEFAKRLHSRMTEEKLRVWYAPEDMKGGQRILEQLERAIHVQDKLLLVLSEASVQSRWVETEIRSAIAREEKEHRQILFPIRITAWDSVKAWKCFDSDKGSDLARRVREIHIPDYSSWKDHDSFEAAFARLLRDLKSEESTGVEPGGD